VDLIEMGRSMVKGMVRKLGVFLGILAVAPLAWGQMDIGWKAVGGHIGLVMPEDPIDTTVGVGGNADLGTLAENVRLEVSFEYWSAGYEFGSEELRGFNFKDFCILVSACYVFTLERYPFKPYAGGGLGFHHFSIPIRWNPITGTAELSSRSDNEIQLQIIGGVMYPATDKITGFGELRYHIGDVDILGLYIGVLFQLAE